MNVVIFHSGLYLEGVYRLQALALHVSQTSHTWNLHQRIYWYPYSCTDILENLQCLYFTPRCSAAVVHVEHVCIMAAVGGSRSPLLKYIYGLSYVSLVTSSAFDSCGHLVAVWSDVMAVWYWLQGVLTLSQFDRFYMIFNEGWKHPSKGTVLAGRWLVYFAIRFYSVQSIKQPSSQSSATNTLGKGTEQSETYVVMHYFVRSSFLYIWVFCSI